MFYQGCLRAQPNSYRIDSRRASFRSGCASRYGARPLGEAWSTSISSLYRAFRFRPTQRCKRSGVCARLHSRAPPCVSSARREQCERGCGRARRERATARFEDICHRVFRVLIFMRTGTQRRCAMWRNAVVRHRRTPSLVRPSVLIGANRTFGWTQKSQKGQKLTLERLANPNCKAAFIGG
jgi:hypothetical protein